MESKGWQEKIQGQLNVIEQWRQSGQSIKAWAQAQDMDAKLLMGWVSYEGRWLRKLGQTQPGARRVTVNAGANSPKQGKGFVAVRGACPPLASHSTMGEARRAAASVRIECASAGVGAGVVLHWPVDHGHELAEWLKAMAAS